jgi:hypothetical protein
MMASPTPVKFDMHRLAPHNNLMSSMRAPSPSRGRKKGTAFVWKNGRAKPVVCVTHHLCLFVYLLKHTEKLQTLS